MAAQAALILAGAGTLGAVAWTCRACSSAGEVPIRAAPDAGPVGGVIEEALLAALAEVVLGAGPASRGAGLANRALSEVAVTALLHTLAGLQEVCVLTDRAPVGAAALETVEGARHAIPVQDKRAFGTLRDTREVIHELSFWTLQAVGLARTSTGEAALVAVQAEGRGLVVESVWGAFFHA